MKKQDLINGAILQARNGDIYIKTVEAFINIETGNIVDIALYNDDLVYPINDERTFVKVSNVVGTKRSTESYGGMESRRWTWEKSEPVLDNIEKKYLLSIINPFKSRVISVKKMSEHNGEYEYIMIKLRGKIKSDETIRLPEFKKGSMYKDMKIDYDYNLREIGLEN